MLSVYKASDRLLDIDVHKVYESLRKLALPKFVDVRQRGNLSEKRITADGGPLLVLYGIREGYSLVLAEIPTDKLLESLQRKDELLPTSENEGKWVKVDDKLPLKIWRHSRGEYHFLHGRFDTSNEARPQHWVNAGWELFNPTNTTTLPLYAEDMTIDRVISALYIKVLSTGSQDGWLTCPMLLGRCDTFCDIVTDILTSLIYDHAFEKIQIPGAAST